MTRLERTIDEMQRAGQEFVLVTVNAGCGSMPRHQGTCMLVRADGQIEGTIGGGKLEANAIVQALEVFAEKQDRSSEFSLSSTQAAEDGMICGGSGTLSFRYCAPERIIEDLPQHDGTLYIFGGGHVLSLIHI